MQPFGRPVVPLVKMRKATSFGVAVNGRCRPIPLSRKVS
jgi:hypothetical protein